MATFVEIDDELNVRVQRLGSLRKRTPNSIMREAITQYLAREESRESFRQEAQASWTAFEETGRHLNAQEVHAWLGVWGTDKEEPAPGCHR